MLERLITKHRSRLRCCCVAVVKQVDQPWYLGWGVHWVYFLFLTLMTQRWMDSFLLIMSINIYGHGVIKLRHKQCNCSSICPGRTQNFQTRWEHWSWGRLPTCGCYCNCYMESPQASQMSIVAGCFLLLEYTDLYVITIEVVKPKI